MKGLLLLLTVKKQLGNILFSYLKKLIEKLVLDWSNCIGNSTDGAANMQEPYKGFSNLLSKYSGN